MDEAGEVLEAVEATQADELLILSNNHVLANENNAKKHPTAISLRTLIS
jgi:hypothetical protein